MTCNRLDRVILVSKMANREKLGKDVKFWYQTRIQGGKLGKSGETLNFEVLLIAKIFTLNRLECNDIHSYTRH